MGDDANPDDLPRRRTAAEEIEHGLSILFRRARRISLRLAAEIDPELEPAAYGTLALIADTGPMRGTELVEVFGLDKSTISRQVAQLVELGLVARIADPTDGRARLIQITEVGAQRLRALQERRRQRLHEQFGSWSTTELDDLAKLLPKLNDLF
ncbi:MarR family winged helix-turn-helix transcriptional regulator [Actinoalloteichus hymeniacidonis]|uniref:MarR family winged helix-turn-helix transcriptional regulator n=1 Tax=Actinoalloteichus hymeniacidonis TaxID=340345 RepID=UPI000853D0F1|nr:MarR family transcriptional regulator [Actinoalloteichus hymeniacidonis]MBB5905867.1 DNA-binding MarR family transcriptional regulator [Actinoalloteichus hymeniacidonis]